MCKFGIEQGRLGRHVRSMLIFEIAAGVLMGGILLAMFLAAAQHMRHVPESEGHTMPWWVYAASAGPMIFLIVQIYLVRS